jgi:hypothetical protein
MGKISKKTDNMKPLNILTIALLLIIGLLKSQAQLQKTYGFENDDYGQVLLKSNESSFYLIGAYSYISRIDTTGNILWEKKIRPKDDWYFNILTDGINADSTDFLLLGNNYQKGRNKENISVVKLNLKGDTIWTRSYGNPYRYCNANRIIRTNDGGYAIIGNGSQTDWRVRDILIIKTDNLGKVLWSKTYGGKSNEDGIALSETDAGDLIIVGQTESYGEGGQDIYILKLNSLGDTIWTKTFGGNRYDYPSDIIKTKSNEFIITGTTSSYGQYYHDDDIFLLKIDGNSNVIWSKTYGGNKDESSTRVILTKDNNYLIVGSTQSYGFGQDDIFLIKTTSEGDTIWTKTYGGSSTDVGRHVIEASKGYYILGDTRSFSVGGKDMCILQINELGNSACRFEKAHTVISNPVWKEHSGNIGGSGCTEEITEFSIVNVSIQSNDMCGCIPPIAKFQVSQTDGSISFTDMSTWADTWLWNFGNGETSNEQNPHYFISGELNVSLTVKNQCGTHTYSEIIFGGGGIKENFQSSLIKIFPNPTKDFVYIKLDENIRVSSINISDILGNEIISIKNISQNPLKINTSMLRQGIYLIRLLTLENMSITKRIIIE